MGRLSLIILLLLSSCSVERQANRLIRHAKKDLDKAALLGFPEKVDTVYITKIIPADSVLVEVPGISKIRDTTVYVTKDRVHIKWVIRHDTLTIAAKCDTVTIKTPVYITRTIHAPKVEGFLSQLNGVFPWLLACLVVVLLILWRILK